MRSRYILLSVAGALALFCVASGQPQDDQRPTDEERYTAFREKMVRTQIEERGITDSAVLAAARKVPRHRFVIDEWKDYSYFDTPLPIEAEQTISQPYIVALMTELLEVDSTSRVLEVGTGSGYQAAILAEIVAEVFTIEIIDTLARTAEALLAELGYDNVSVRVGDGYQGWPGEAPFDGIIVTCAPPAVPQPLIDQLAENGRLVIPVGEGYQELLLLRRTPDSVTTASVTPVRFVPMTGEAQGGSTDE